MRPYDGHRATLDPGLTALALRARENAAGRYPFIERALRVRRWWLLGAGLFAGCLALWRRREPAERRPSRPDAPAAPNAPRR